MQHLRNLIFDGREQDLYATGVLSASDVKPTIYYYNNRDGNNDNWAIFQQPQKTTKPYVEPGGKKE